ncbi:hypothetical protein, partial [Enterobacter asburiae]|uniref:hypothetical protein n=1 Tax=Enterobacter asburiae TaxID=61645 RepID=UPI001C4009C4
MSSLQAEGEKVSRRGWVRFDLPDGAALTGPTKPLGMISDAQSKKPRTLRYGVLLIDAWQFP